MIVDFKSIAIVTYGMRKGGTERVISILANYLVSKGVKVSIFTFKSGECEYQLDEQIKLTKLTQVVDSGEKVKMFEVLKRLAKLRKEIKKSKPDITLMLPEELSAFAIVALLGTATKKVISERNDPNIMPRNKLKRLLRQLFYITADGFIFQTAEAQSYFSPAIRNKSVIIHNPITPSITRVKREHVKNEIVGVGRLESQKNFKLLIEAFANVANHDQHVQLKIFGEGSLKEELQQQISKLNLTERATLCGKSDDVFNEIKDAKLFVMSSNFEGMPNALMEAMALGVPVISTDCPSGGPRELIESHVNGLLVRVNDVASLSQAMIEVIDNVSLQKSLSLEGSKLLVTHNEGVILEQWYMYLCQIINKELV